MPRVRNYKRHQRKRGKNIQNRGHFKIAFEKTHKNRTALRNTMQTHSQQKNETK